MSDVQGGADSTKSGTPKVLLCFEELASYFSNERKLTAAGLVPPKDARFLIEAMDIDKEFHAQGGRSALTFRSSSELVEFDLLLQWGLTAGVVRKNRGRLVTTAAWTKSTDTQKLSRMIDALIKLGPLRTRMRGGWESYIQIASVVDETWPDLLACAWAGPVGIGSAALRLGLYLTTVFEFGGPWSDPVSIVQLAEGELGSLCEILELAGLLEVKWKPDEIRPSQKRPVVIYGTPLCATLVQSDGFLDGKRSIFLPGIDVNPQGELFELQVVLEEIEPPICRDLVVPASITLSGLHHVLQIAMGWTDAHLHEFVLGDSRYGVTSDEEWGEPVIDERLIRLGDVLRVGEHLSYEYDFGDGWSHAIEVVAQYPTGSNPVLRCIEAQRHCPPEDVGGPGGYADFLDALSGDSPQRAELLEWAGGSFEPEQADLADINLRLQGFCDPESVPLLSPYAWA